MKEVVSRELCSGCGECAAVCPVHAITMQTGERGFRVPRINQSSCINCKKCINLCAIKNSNNLKLPEGIAFGAINLNDDARKNSSSGGAFSALGETFLSKGGVVYGAISSDNVISHDETTTISGLIKMRGSKYVQSNIESVFSNIEAELKAGQQVLFSGTPCQCAAVKSYLSGKHINSDGLILIDIVCHGVCSPLVFKDYIEFCNSRSGSDVIEHIFRSKVNGWRNHTEENILANGVIDYKSFDSQLFKSFFYSHYTLRESCFHCPFATPQRVADITMADFWGLQQSIPTEYSPDGVSFLLANSDKGRMLIKSAESKMRVFSAQIDDTEQPQLHQPSKKPENVQRFWHEYEKGFKYVAVKYFHAGKIRRFLTDTIKKIIKVR